eukprot:scaffold97748_cov66-Phaeocystis_antarctica.AAC.2
MCTPRCSAQTARRRSRCSTLALARACSRASGALPPRRATSAQRRGTPPPCSATSCASTSARQARYLHACRTTLGPAGTHASRHTLTHGAPGAAERGAPGGSSAPLACRLVRRGGLLARPLIPAPRKTAWGNGGAGAAATAHTRRRGGGGGGRRGGRRRRRRAAAGLAAGGRDLDCRQARL